MQYWTIRLDKKVWLSNTENDFTEKNKNRRSMTDEAAAQTILIPSPSQHSLPEQGDTLSLRKLLKTQLFRDHLLSTQRLSFSPPLSCSDLFLQLLAVSCTRSI